MNSKLVKASLAGAAAIALAAGGGTFAAYSDYGSITGNSVGAGFLKLDINGADGSSAATPISWGKLAPGMVNVRTIWLASNDGQSVPNATLAATFNNLNDQENGCSSQSERDADPNNCDANAPNTGELSHILNFQAGYYPVDTTSDQCKSYANQNTPPDNWNAGFFASNQGDLYNVAEGTTGHTYTLTDPTTHNPIVLAPGKGICIGFNAYWPHDPSNQVTAPYNNDNVAQGDSFTFDVKFTLSQV